MITGVIDIPYTEDVPDSSAPYNISSYSLNISGNRDSGYTAAETTSYDNLLWLNASPPTTINPLLSDSDAADTVSSQSSQIKTFWSEEGTEGTLAETGPDHHNADTWEQQASFATEYPYYEYQDTGQSLYPDPVLSLAQENSNLMLSPSYNFSGLQVSAWLGVASRTGAASVPSRQCIFHADVILLEIWNEINITLTSSS